MRAVKGGCDKEIQPLFKICQVLLIKNISIKKSVFMGLFTNWREEKINILLNHNETHKWGAHVWLET